jgi:glutamate-1-semialdehyde aminotransferase
MFGTVLGIEEEPHDFRDYFKGDGELYEKLALHLIQKGVLPDGDAREPWFLCYALSDDDVNETLNKFNDAVKAAKA